MTKHLEISSEDISALFPKISNDAHKGCMGRVLCVCGSYDGTGNSMCGAAYFSAAAAYKCGAGIAQIFTHRKNYESLGALVPEAVFTLYDPEEEDNNSIAAKLIYEMKKADSVVMGCGLGNSELSKTLVCTVLENVSVPLVIDADGLNIISENDCLWHLLSDEQRSRTVITPHMGEMSRLSKKTIEEICSSPVTHAMKYASGLKINCLLKNHRTVITDGHTVFINNSGNPGMATGGMGDVLSGIIGALFARKTIADWASDERRILPTHLYRAATAAYLHGLAGNEASEKHGEYSLAASDVVNALPEIIKEHC